MPFSPNSALCPKNYPRYEIVRAHSKITLHWVLYKKVTQINMAIPPQVALKRRYIKINIYHDFHRADWLWKMPRALP